MLSGQSVPGWLVRWFDNHAADSSLRSQDDKRIDWLRCVPFIGMHAACGAVLWVGWSPVAVWVAVGFYAVRMFAITGFYHRYFSHRSFKTSRWFQAVMAFVGAASVQRDPLWWASHHFHHHANSDDPQDPHSPAQLGFWMSHVGWFMTANGFLTRDRYVQDWARFPELRWLNRFDLVPPIILAVSVFLTGDFLAEHAPHLGTNGPQLLVWGFFISTVVLYHATFTVNSLAHQFGSRRYETGDDSRNNWLIALLTFGEGWHNNHHHYPGSTRQGFFWWEVDLTYYGLFLLKQLGLVWDLRPVPSHALSGKQPAGESA